MRPLRPPQAATGGVMHMSNEDELADLLIGHRIVSSKLVSDSAYLVLDDGTHVRLRANEGCGGCPAGYYEVTHLANVDNVITNVREEVEPVDGPYYEEAYSYKIFVVSENQDILLAQVDGDDGNG